MPARSGECCRRRRLGWLRLCRLPLLPCVPLEPQPPLHTMEQLLLPLHLRHAGHGLAGHRPARKYQMGGRGPCACQESASSAALHVEKWMHRKRCSAHPPFNMWPPSRYARYVIQGARQSKICGSVEPDVSIISTPMAKICKQTEQHYQRTGFKQNPFSMLTCVAYMMVAPRFSPSCLKKSKRSSLRMVATL